MIIRSRYLTEGLFGQIFLWMLEVLPYIERKGIRPNWQILSKNYGLAPDFNIIPSLLEPKVESKNTEANQSKTILFETLKSEHSYFFGDDFVKANYYWNKYFSTPQDVANTIEQFVQKNFAGHVVLGLHYRGTDKNVDLNQTSPVTREDFLLMTRDFVEKHPEITKIFLATDEEGLIAEVQKIRPVICYEQQRSSDGKPLWNRHTDSQNVAMAKEAMVDCITLSHCNYALKCMSQLSAFAKIYNPQLKVYRISACKPKWFPECSIPLYRPTGEAASLLAKRLQKGDSSISLLNRMWCRFKESFQ